MTSTRLAILSLLAACWWLTGCASTPTRNTPLEVWGDMAHQPKYKAQGQSKFFPNGAAGRSPVPGTIAYGHLEPSDVLHTGVSGADYVGKMPINVTAETLQNGQAKFNTYCSPCHSRVGDGRGIVGARSGWIASSLVDDRAINMADGYIFHVITNGVRSMPSYKTQIEASDRWAIIAYVRALQKAHNGSADDVPADAKGRLE